MPPSANVLLRQKRNVWKLGTLTPNLRVNFGTLTPKAGVISKPLLYHVDTQNRPSPQIDIESLVDRLRAAAFTMEDKRMKICLYEIIVMALNGWDTYAVNNSQLKDSRCFALLDLFSEYQHHLKLVKKLVELTMDMERAESKSAKKEMAEALAPLRNAMELLDSKSGKKLSNLKELSEKLFNLVQSTAIKILTDHKKDPTIRPYDQDILADCKEIFLESKNYIYAYAAALEVAGKMYAPWAWTTIQRCHHEGDLSKLGGEGAFREATDSLFLVRQKRTSEGYRWRVTMGLPT